MTAPKYFFTSDTHFSHRNIIQYCKRPFADPDEMDEEMITRWNAVVGPHDMVYHTGDVSLLKKHSMNHDKLRHMLSRLHGKKHIVWGNHDRGVQQTILSAGFHDLGLLYELNVPPESNNGERQKIILCHYSMRVWNESHYGSLQFYGHSHGSMKVSCNQLDVGVDNAFKLLGEFRPFSLDEAVTFARSYPVTLDQVDHHSK